MRLLPYRVEGWREETRGWRSGLATQNDEAQGRTGGWTRGDDDMISKNLTYFNGLRVAGGSPCCAPPTAVKPLRPDASEHDGCHESNVVVACSLLNVTILLEVQL